nr:unnamed protein product [Mus musculus]
MTVFCHPQSSASEIGGWNLLLFQHHEKNEWGDQEMAELESMTLYQPRLWVRMCGFHSPGRLPNQHREHATEDSPWNVLGPPWRFSTGQDPGCETHRMVFHHESPMTCRRRNVISLAVWMH